MLAAAAEVEGTAVLAAAHENRAALAQPGERYTAFTGELVSALEKGSTESARWSACARCSGIWSARFG